MFNIRMICSEISKIFSFLLVINAVLSLYSQSENNCVFYKGMLSLQEEKRRNKKERFISSLIQTKREANTLQLPGIS